MTVKLKNGATEFGPGITVLMIVLRDLATSMEITDSLALYELWARCHDDTHRYFSPALQKRLADLALIQQDGSVHDSVRNVVLCSVAFQAEDGGFLILDPAAVEGGVQELPKGPPKRTVPFLTGLATYSSSGPAWSERGGGDCEGLADSGLLVGPRKH